MEQTLDICLPGKVTIYQVEDCATGELEGVCTEIDDHPRAAPCPIRSPTTLQEPCTKRIRSKPQRTETKSQRLSKAQAKKFRLRKVRSRELYSGVVYTDCDCYHRNGLQHDCPRTSCGGPPCKVKPWPECDLALHFMQKWQSYYDVLDELPPTSFCGPKEAWLAILEEEKKAREQREKQASKKCELVHSKKSERIATLACH